MVIEKYSHAVGEFNYHLQLTPAFRIKVFANKRIRKLMEAYLVDKIEVLGLDLVAIEFGQDHVHIFIARCKNYAPCQIVQFLKGYTSRMMRKNHWRLVSHYFWGKKFWSGGYYAGSVGDTTSDAVKHYIQETQGKHW